LSHFYNQAQYLVLFPGVPFQLFEVVVEPLVLEDDWAYKIRYTAYRDALQGFATLRGWIIASLDPITAALIGKLPNFRGFTCRNIVEYVRDRFGALTYASCVESFFSSLHAALPSDTLSAVVVKHMTCHDLFERSVQPLPNILKVYGLVTSLQGRHAECIARYFDETPVLANITFDALVLRLQQSLDTAQPVLMPQGGDAPIGAGDAANIPPKKKEPSNLPRPSFYCWFHGYRGHWGTTCVEALTDAQRAATNPTMCPNGNASGKKPTK
jgi:hypothetical protein